MCHGMRYAAISATSQRAFRKVDILSLLSVMDPLWMGMSGRSKQAFEVRLEMRKRLSLSSKGEACRMEPPNRPAHHYLGPFFTLRRSRACAIRANLGTRPDETLRQHRTVLTGLVTEYGRFHSGAAARGRHCRVRPKTTTFVQLASSVPLKCS
jgi:hypothetical protein